MRHLTFLFPTKPRNWCAPYPDSKHPGVDGTLARARRPRAAGGYSLGTPVFLMTRDHSLSAVTSPPPKRALQPGVAPTLASKRRGCVRDDGITTARPRGQGRLPFAPGAQALDPAS